MHRAARPDPGETMSIAVRTITSLLALGAAAAITAAPATAAPSTGSAGGSSSSGCGPRSNADYHFLAESYFDEEPCEDRKSTRLNSSHVKSSYAVFCLKKK